MAKKSEFSYDSDVGRWWLSKSINGSHQRAYRKIADFIRDSFGRDPGLIVDYACGSAPLLALLSERFPKSKLVGLDGSRLLLYQALQRISKLPEESARRISLIETQLPNYDILKGKADLAVFCFPNMVPFPAGDSVVGARDCLSENDRKIARSLLLESDPGEGDLQVSSVPAEPSLLEQGRCISFNLRRLLTKGGVCVRIEYATVKRDELSPSELAYVSFEEGSLDTRVGGRLPRLWFRLQASAYFRSQVLDDVYDHTGDERDRNGGYLITVLRAV